MKIVLNQQKRMKRGELILAFHPRNKDLAISIKQLIESKTGEIEVKDEYHNHFFIPLLNVYYFEVIERKVFVYTKEEVYRMRMTFPELKTIVLDKGFVQVNVRTMVNERYITSYEMMEGCRRRLILVNQENIISNRHFRDDVDDMIKRRNIILQKHKKIDKKNIQ